MADHNLPTTSSLYTDVIAQLMARINESLMLSSVGDASPTNMPTGSLRRNGLNVERWSGTAWAAVARMLSTDNAAALTALGVSAFIRQLLDDTDAAAARSTLGAQASDATLTALAAITTAANKLVYATGSDAFSTTDFTAFARTLLDDADAATARATLGLTIGTNVQAHDATLAALAGLALAADKMIYATGADQVATTTLTAFARTLLDDADAAAARSTLGAQASGEYLSVGSGANVYSTTRQGIECGRGSGSVALIVNDGSGNANLVFNHLYGTPDSNGNSGRIMVNVDDQNPAFMAFLLGSGSAAGIPLALKWMFAISLDGGGFCESYAQLRAPSISEGGVTLSEKYQSNDATLTALAAITTAANKLVYATGSDAFSTTDFTAFARTLLDDADAATARTTLGLTIGTNVQAHNATLAVLAGLTPTADRLPYFTGASTAALASLTAFGRSLIDDADASAARATLGAAALASFAGVNSGSGYRKIPMSGGADLIIQWGSGTGVNITFPISFAFACYAVTPVCIDVNQATVNLSGNPSTTGFSVKKYYVNTQLDVLAFNWIAVGV